MQVVITSQYPIEEEINPDEGRYSCQQKLKTFVYDNVKSVKVSDDKAILSISKGVTATVNFVSEILIRR